MSWVTKAQKQHRRERRARQRRWFRGYVKSRHGRKHHRCAGQGCDWGPRRLIRSTRRHAEGGK